MPLLHYISRLNELTSKLKLSPRIELFLLFLTIAFMGATHHDKVRVAPGVIYHDMKSDEGPRSIGVLEIDLTNPFIKLTSVKADNQLAARERTSELSHLMDYPSHWVVGAINGDFFSLEGVPEGMQAMDGRIISSPNKWSAFGMTANGKPFIEIIQLNATVLARNGKTHDIHGINDPRLTGDMIVYNSFYGTTTGTNPWGIEALITAEDEYTINDTMRAIISRMEDGKGNMPIPADGFVLSGHDESREFILNNFRVGDAVKIYLGLSPEKRKVKDVIGGVPRIVRDGHVSVEHRLEGISDKFALDRHPRTAVGFSQDSTRLYFVTVDGRQPDHSVGMSLYELADFMVGFGIHQGLNLDGGGSTTMVVRNRVVNRPSDATEERPVANALLVISTAPSGDPSQIRIIPRNIILSPGQNQQFSVQILDSNDNPVSGFHTSILWRCDAAIGSITPEGIFSSVAAGDSGFIYARSINMGDSIKINSRCQ